MSSVSNATITMSDGSVVDKVVTVDPTTGNPIGRNSNLATAQVTVAQAAIQLAAARSRDSLRIMNTGANTVFVGPTNAVAATTGYPITAGSEREFKTGTALYGISTTGSNVVGVVEAY